MTDVSIRRTIESLLGDEQQQEAFLASPETFFAEHGIDELPGELIGTAFVHYSDTAPIEHGDAVAGISTHYSTVPFEVDDLPGMTFGESEGTTPFASLGLLTSDDLSDPYDRDVFDDQPAPADHVDDGIADDGIDDQTADGNDLASDDAFTEAAATLDETTLDETTLDETSLEQTADDDIDSASFHDEIFDDGFSDGFDEAEALDANDDAGFGDGGSHSGGPTEILGEIHGAGPLDPELDDPFFDDVTDDGIPTVLIEFEPIDFEQEGFQHDGSEHLVHETGHEIGHEMSHDAFPEHHVEEFDDVDPSDLDLDDF